MTELPDVSETAIKQILHETNPSGQRDMDSSTFMEMMKFLDVPEELDENNPVELNIDSPEFMEMLQLPADPREWGIQ